MELSKFKNVLKEVIREVIQEELKDVKTILAEQAIMQYRQTQIQQPQYQSNTPKSSLEKLLEETKAGMNEDFSRVMNFDSSNVQGGFNPNQFMNEGQHGMVATGTVADMFRHSNKSVRDEQQVQVNVVPDYSKLMKKMIADGSI